MAESLRDSENRGIAAVSVSERLTHVNNSQPRYVAPIHALTPALSQRERGLFRNKPA